MKIKRIQHHIDGLMTLIIFGIFAACTLTTLLAGAKAYSRLTQRDKLAYDRRTCVQYVAARVRGADSANVISIEKFGDSDALVLNGDGYITRIYCCGGYLRELYCNENRYAKPEEGERIIEAESLRLSQKGEILKAEITTPDGENNTLILSPRSGMRR